ncbi:hypothetical protein [Streptomyces sulphureus]|uniref:hypothetical protein n=1 Tax=Streptomyces sulphureus TaxID=47758 RepID=UPI00037E9A90|nr:hypothetical protein [Streptomyces sulphureus]
MAGEPLRFQTLDNLRLGKLKRAVDAWTSMESDLKEIGDGGEGTTAATLERTSRNADWKGENAAVTQRFTRKTAEQIRAMADHAENVRDVLRNAHTAFEAFKKQLDRQVEDAAERHIRVLPNGTVEPVEDLSEADTPSPLVLSRVKQNIDRILAGAGSADEAARSSLAELAEDRHAFQKTTSSADRNLLEEIAESAKGQVVPPKDDGLQLASWGYGHLNTAAGTTVSWFTNVEHGHFAPRVNGQFAPIAPTVLGRTRQALDSRNFVPKANRAVQHSRWATAGKWAGGIGNVVGGATSAYGQWTDDTGRGYHTGERVGRAATRGLGVGLGGWGGAAAGAKLGGAIGTAVGGPVGTVVGGFVGGAVGGIVGSGVGNEAADYAVDLGGKLVDGVGNGLGKVGDKLKFWD